MCAPVSLLAHPHVWIQYDAQARLIDGGVSSVLVRWTFDELFSKTLIKDMDENGDLEFQPEEVAIVYEYAFIGLEQSSFFANVWIGGDSVALGDAERFDASIVDGAVVYEFDLLVDAPPGRVSQVDVAFVDLTNFIAFGPVANRLPEAGTDQAFTRALSATVFLLDGIGDVQVPSIRLTRR